MIKGIPIKDQYRIVTNGIVFRIEKLMSRGFFKKKNVWEQVRVFDFGHLSGFVGTKIISYATKEEAQKDMSDYIKHDMAVEHGWTPV